MFHMNGKSEHKVLGINWDLINDTLSVAGPSINDVSCVWTKRKVLQLLVVFVTNRLKEIKSLDGVTFKHISSEDNPADLATRGKSCHHLSDGWVLRG